MYTVSGLHFRLGGPLSLYDALSLMSAVASIVSVLIQLARRSPDVDTPFSDQQTFIQRQHVLIKWLAVTNLLGAISE